MRRSTAPYWIRTNYGGKCDSCRLGIKKGDEALYYPATKKLLCGGHECGRKVEKEEKEEKRDAFLYGAWHD